MSTTFLVYFCRIASILLMYSALFVGSFCTIFIGREIFRHSQLRTSLNFLIFTIFGIDCLRAFLCAPLETFVMIQTWSNTINGCQQKAFTIDNNNIVLNFCRFTTVVRTCFSVAQPLDFIAIAYERLRTIVKRNGNLNFNMTFRNQDLFRLKYVMIWLGSSLLIGLIVGIYQGLVYSQSNTCYGRSNELTRDGFIIRLFFIIFAAVTSGFIYAKIFLIVRQHQRGRIQPMNIVDINQIRQKQLLMQIKRKDLRSAKHTFIIFISFFLCRIPFVIAMFTGLIFYQPLSTYGQCYYEELSNLAVQVIFLATISDPLTYIWAHPKLRQEFSRLSIRTVYFIQRLVR